MAGDLLHCRSSTAIKKLSTKYHYFLVPLTVLLYFKGDTLSQRLPQWYPLRQAHMGGLVNGLYIFKELKKRFHQRFNLTLTYTAVVPKCLPMKTYNCLKKIKWKPHMIRCYKYIYYCYILEGLYRYIGPLKEGLYCYIGYLTNCPLKSNNIESWKPIVGCVTEYRSQKNGQYATATEPRLYWPFC